MKCKITFNMEDRYKYQLKCKILKWLKINMYGIISFMIMGMIFMFSSQNGQDSAIMSTNLKSLCENIFGLNYLVHIFNIRKLAHFILFGLLGTSIFTHIRYKYYFTYKYMYYLISLIITSVYACMDETHQLFVFGRGASFTDIMIDFSGCLVALIINFIVITLLEKRNMRIKRQLSDIYKN